MEAFPIEDHANDLKDLDLGGDSLPVQRSLGLCWDFKKDAFLFQATTCDGGLGSQRFERFSSWKVLVRAIACLRHIACLFKKPSKDSPGSCKG